MQITPYQWNSQINGISAVGMQQYRYQDGAGTQTSIGSGEDQLSISPQGKHMAMRMQRMRGVDPQAMKEKMNGMKQAISDLDLENLDLENMSSEDLQAKATEIHETMSTFRPEGAPERSFEATDYTDDELSQMITGFSDQASRMESRMARMEEMAGRMRGMTGIGRTGGKPPMQAMQQMMGQQETEDVEEESLIDTLLAALEEADEDESNTFYETIYGYMETQGVIL